MRTYVIRMHDMRPDFPLDDMPGAGGRADVACRFVAACLCMSHDVRSDATAVVCLGGPGAPGTDPVAVRFEGATIRGLRPDERSVGGLLLSALARRHEDPWWKEVQPGLAVAPYTLGDVVSDARGAPVVLDKDGTPLSSFQAPADPVFLLGDHRPLSGGDLAGIEAPAVSLGPSWYHTDHAVHVLQHHLDTEA